MGNMLQRKEPYQEGRRKTSEVVPALSATNKESVEGTQEESQGPSKKKSKTTKSSKILTVPSQKVTVTKK